MGVDETLLDELTTDDVELDTEETDDSLDCTLLVLLTELLVCCELDDDGLPEPQATRTAPANISAVAFMPTPARRS